MRGRGFSVRKIPCPRVSMTCMPGGTDCDLHGRTTGNGATERCLLLSPSTTHTTRGRLGRVCAVHSPRLPKAQAAFGLSLLAPPFVFSRLSFPTMLVFFYDFVFLCVVVGQNQYPTATSGFLDGLAAHTAVLLDASHSRRVGVLSERIPPSALSILR